MKRLVPLVAVALLFGGCVNIGSKSDGPAVVYYVLEDGGSQRETPPAPAPTPAAPLTLVVLDAHASSFYDSDQLVFSRTPGTRGQYQFARWAERPGKRLGELMRARIDAQGAWQVSQGGGYVRGDRLLDTALLEFYHDASTRPGEVRLVLRAELVDLTARQVIGRHVFEQRAPLDHYDAAGAAKASAVAVGRLLDDLVAWLASVQ
jgi:cholesterol transport system auxiliary component